MKLKFSKSNFKENQKLIKEKKYDEKTINFSKKPSIQNRHVVNIDKLKEVYNDLETNHNHSWIEEIYLRNKNDLESPALFYRGTVISYKEMFSKIIDTAKALKKIGVSANDEIAMCVSNCPEMVYFLGALNLIGAKPNIFGEDFAPDYIKEIIEGCSSKLLIVTDNIYEKIATNKIENFVLNSNVENKVIISLTDSLKTGTVPYLHGNNVKYQFVNNTYYFKKDDDKALNFNEFIKLGKNYEGDLKHDVKLRDDFTITYTSGSTKDGRPKAIVHTNNSFISMARFHDKELSRLPETKKIRGLAHIPCHSNTNLITSVSDTLSQGGTVALEPIYEPNFFVQSLLINKPNFVPATTSFWIKAIKTINNCKENIQMPFLFIPVAVGEPTSPGEEKFINKGLRKLNAGRDKLKVTTAPLSMGGGDCEHGGLFFRLYKSLYDKISISKDPRGLTPFQLASPVVLREDGTECDYGEIGRLATNSRCTMKEYKNNPEATKNFFITDAYGRKWADNKVWGYIDNFGDVHIKGRMGNELELSNGAKVPPFMIADAILKDTKNILSCEVVMIRDKDDSLIPVAHIELQPDKKKSVDTIISGIVNRIDDNCSSLVTDSLFLRLRNNEEAYPLTGCGKRSVLALEKEGITDKCIKLSDYCYRNHNTMPKIKIKK